MRILLSFLVAVSLSAQAPYLVKDFVEGPPSVNLGDIVPVDDWIYFNVYHASPPHFYSLWRSDGTAGGTIKLYADDHLDGNDPYLALGRTLFFSMAHDHLSLWRTDGTSQGTKPVTEVVEGFGKRFGFVLGDRILIESSDSRLWSASLTPGRPPRSLGTEGANGFTRLVDRAHYFTGNPHGVGGMLSSTDGTPEGTHSVGTFEEGGADLVTLDGHVYFTSASRTKLWRSDGTFDGTILLATFQQQIGRLWVAETKIFFVGEEDSRLWVTDGTAAGTRQLSRPFGRWTILGDKVIYRSLGPAGGTELWVSDGTPEGTHVLKTMQTAEFSLTRAGALVYFTGLDISSGWELWRTDGTAEGTKLVADIVPGWVSSAPEDLTAAGERLFFTAWTQDIGRELWALPPPDTPRIGVNDVRVAEEATTAQFMASLSSAAKETVTVEFATTDFTATAGSDYDAASGTLTFAPGETSRTIDVQLWPDDVKENNETFSLTLRNASGATIESGTAAAIIEDDDRSADVGLALDFSQLGWGTVSIDITNDGPDMATNFWKHRTATPGGTDTDACGAWKCTDTILPGARQQEPGSATGFGRDQGYFTFSVRARENDSSSSNNTIAWTVKDTLAMEAVQLTPGSGARVWFARHIAGIAKVESSDPSVLAVPASVEFPAWEPVSFMVTAVAPGAATIRVFTAENEMHTLAVDVVAPGVSRRWPGAFAVSLDGTLRTFAMPHRADVGPGGSVPFTGATATGPVTVTANGIEVGRIVLTPESRGPQRTWVYLPHVGENLLTFSSPGDTNFLPHEKTWTVKRARGTATIAATAVRHGSRVVVRAHLTGSPMGSPGGTIRIGNGTETPLKAIGPEIAYAEATAEDVPESTTTLRLAYSGDTRYVGSQKNVQIQMARRRSSRQ